jgi:hypothetical protein
MDERFITPEVIREIDACDVSFTEYNTVRALRLEDGQFEKNCFGGAWAMRDRTRDSAYYNRVVGFCECDADRLEDLIEYYAEIGKDCAISLTPDAANERLLARLGEAGFRLLQAACLFTRRSAEDVQADFPGIAIRRAQERDLSVVFDLWSIPFDSPVGPEVRELRAAAQMVPEFPIYVASIGGEDVAMATMYLGPRVAWLGNANTRTERRRSGCQSALLQHRAAEAARMGRDWMVTDTEFGSTSHRNALRAGFGLAYVPLMLSRPRAK